MTKNIALDIDFLVGEVEQGIKKVRVVNNDLANEYFDIKTGNRDDLDEARMLFSYCDSARLRNDIIGDYLKELETQVDDLQKLVSRLIREGGEKQ